MDCFNVTILGCGSATPTLRHLPTSQVVNFRDNLFMVDCGEGAQLELRRQKLKFQRISHIFLSHLHGDHCFGLMGFLSTLGLVQRGGEVVIHAEPDAERVFGGQLAYFCNNLPFTIRFESFSPDVSEVIYADRSLTVRTLPLTHRVPTAGFLFEERPRPAHLKAEVVEALNIPRGDYWRIKEGEDWVTADGRVVPNNQLTTPAAAPRRYAYCSDTRYNPALVPLIEGVDLLYHEATYLHELQALAYERWHSTAFEAAMIARDAHVGQLCIGHYSARYQTVDALLSEARSIFPNTVAAQEGLVVDLPKTTDTAPAEEEDADKAAEASAVAPAEKSALAEVADRPKETDIQQ
jgi:ribonuclease Z